MCGRFSLVTDAENLHRYYGLVNAGQFAGPRFNIAPGQSVATIVAVDGERHLEFFHWGLIPHWSKEKRLKYSTINARVETIESKPAYRDAFRQHRCIIPADGFYEWQGDEGHKQPWRIEPADRDELFSFAGLWDVWEGKGEVLRSCTIIVSDASEEVRPIHERMPLMLASSAWRKWLDANTPLDEVRRIMGQRQESALQVYRVDSYVNNPQHDDPRCLQRSP